MRQLPLLTAIAMACVSTATSAELIVQDARIYPSSASQMATATAILQNNGDEPLQITALSAPAAERTELHSITMSDGMMSMRRVPTLTLATGETISLSKSGLHIMLYGLQTGDEISTHIPILFSFESGLSQSVEFQQVKAKQDAHKTH